MAEGFMQFLQHVEIVAAKENAHPSKMSALGLLPQR
jgi:hypothetical protein